MSNLFLNFHKLTTGGYNFSRGSTNNVRRNINKQDNYSGGGNHCTNSTNDRMSNISRPRKLNRSRDLIVNIYNHLKRFHRNENGSLSLLIIGLFIAALSALMIVTDLAVVANAKRTLGQATEAAAMRAVQNLDKNAYYSGKHTLLTLAFATLGAADSIDNRIPVDCNKGWQEVNDEMATWMNTSSNMKTLQIENYEITMYDCVYDVVHLETKAKVKLPFPAPFSQLDRTTIYSSITTLTEKDKGLWLFGWRLY
jgi:hypothetical protein